MHPVTARATRLFVVAALAAFAISCTRDPKVLTAQHVQRADQFLANNRLGDAIVEYRRALAYSPRAGEIHLKLARLYMKMDALREAYPEFLRAADAMPDDENAQLQAGNLLLMAGRYQDAKTRARVALKKNPQSVPALVLLGNSLAGLKDMESAIEVSQQAALLEPTKSGLYRNIGVFQLAKGDIDLAERAFKRALEVDPKSISAYLALAEMYRIAGRSSQVEATLR